MEVKNITYGVNKNITRSIQTMEEHYFERLIIFL
jgi:hypothetical protein